MVVGVTVMVVSISIRDRESEKPISNRERKHGFLYADLRRRKKALIKELSVPPPGSNDLHFPTKYSQSSSTQWLACLWKQHLSYWRNPPYNAVRLFFTTLLALLFGSVYWGLGSKTEKQQDLFNAMGSMYMAVMFLGAQNSSTIQPLVAIERSVFYRERAAGMYSALPYAFAQALIYGARGLGLFYDRIRMGGRKVFLRIPVWWRWFYWACPVAWTLYGLVASQFGDVKGLMESGETVEEFVRAYFGFRHDFLGVVAVMLIGFVVVFASVFAFIKVLSFQKR
ncbi:putative pleiotropic drug resistance protein 2 [Acorus calamus]|uniref:Pleiotropic drug resistance protein 2 n=1 Tax=Acorus calamus TaxID=4465 RepID=A0AAV9DV33_ACOCL|nr:putative pleiotropic drug resistance protein 2 [Acorus calamus]